MFGLLKKLFGISEKQIEEVAPGRTFKRILTGDYFGLRNPDVTPEMVQKAKEEKVEKINALELKPMFLRYAHKKDLQTGEKYITSAHVVFQKEVFDKKLNMIHVTEISFIIPKEEFEEFEQMAGVSLEKDFRNLYETDSSYQGKERRKVPRPSPLIDMEQV
jgi:hypothetical protein